MPRKVSFLPGMRYYAGNWDTGLWCIKPSASAKIEAGIVAIASMPAAQLERFYGSPEAAQIPPLHGICVPLLQQSRPRTLHARTSRHEWNPPRNSTYSPTANGSAAPRWAGTSATATSPTSSSSNHSSAVADSSRARCGSSCSTPSRFIVRRRSTA